MMDSKIVSSYVNASMTRDTSDQHHSFYNLVKSESRRLLSMSKISHPTKTTTSQHPSEPLPIQKDKVKLRITSSPSKSRQHLL
mmetsp:Transcript_27732/g.42028  ORF Transcript_27732/g.42028 Transcript_27732/m.42028 type:complete len:83 (+) Transcript_27732:109-357(+)